MTFHFEDREDHRPDNAAERAVHRKKCLEAQLRVRDMERPTTGEMLRVIGLSYSDPVAAKGAAMNVWREQGRVLTYATAVELLYSRLVQDEEREAELLAMYAKKRGERK